MACAKMGVGDSCSYVCPLGARFNLQASAELHNSFSHACDANAKRLRSGRMVQDPLRYSPAFVIDFYDDSIEILRNLHFGFAGSRVQVNICEAGLHDAED